VEAAAAAAAVAVPAAVNGFEELGLVVGPGRYYSPRHPTRFETSFFS